MLHDPRSSFRVAVVRPKKEEKGFRKRKKNIDNRHMEVVMASMARYEYAARPPTGGWLLEVRKDGSPKGNIRKNPVTGRYQFYRGRLNVLRPSLEESNLETLKEKIEKLDL